MVLATASLSGGKWTPRVQGLTAVQMIVSVNVSLGLSVSRLSEQSVCGVLLLFLLSLLKEFGDGFKHRARQYIEAIKLADLYAGSYHPFYLSDFSFLTGLFPNCSPQSDLQLLMNTLGSSTL